ncbi:MAG: RNA polymerase factor sigma-32 [Alphaproteobacteria bacterium]
MAAVESFEVRRANRRFIRESMRVPLLSRAHEMSLARRWRDDGDVEALHELVTAYVRIVIRAASYYRRYGLPMGDLIQEGIVGLMMAAARFDPDREARFSTYAGWWVRSAMQDFILRNWSIVRTGTTAAQKTLFFNLRRLRARIEGDPDGPLTSAARNLIADELEVAAGDVAMMEGRLAGGDQSLNARVSDVDDDEWQDLLVDSGPSPEELAADTRDAATRSRWLAAALAELSARERKIIAARRLRDDAVTLERLGRKFGISKERVRQIEHRALDKIKRSIIRQSGATGGRDLFGA